MTAQGPLAFIPLTGARDLIAFLLMTGAALLVVLSLRGEISAQALRDARLYGVTGMLVGSGYVALATFLAPFVALWPATHRLFACLACALGSLPFFAATEWLLRGVGRVWLPLLGKAIALGVLILASAEGE